MKPFLPVTRIGALALLLAACHPLPQAAPTAPAKTASVTVQFDLGRDLLAKKRYTRADIDHVTLKVFKNDNGTLTLAGSMNIAPNQLGDQVTLDSLAQNTTYSLKAEAYDTPGDDPSHIISRPVSMAVTTAPIPTQALVKLPIQLLPYTPNFGHVEPSFLTDFGAVKSIAMDSFYFYYIDGNGDAYRFPIANPSDVLMVPGPFDHIAVGGAGTLGASRTGGITMLLFDEEWTVPLDTNVAVDAMAVSPTDGQLYIATGGNLVKLTFDVDAAYGGESVTPVETTVATGCYTNPAHLTVSPAGDFYALEDGGTNVVKVSAGGSVSTLTGIAGQSGLAFSPEGDMYIASRTTHEIVRLVDGGPAAPFVGSPGNPGPDAGQGANATFDTPGAMVCGANGTLYVLDAGNDVLRRVF